MISVILYGRNDAHGYNLHKRAAISLNCIAHLLSHPDDEIIFVDCNTPDDLPTFPEAIQDTLTPCAKRLLRVLRLRPALYEQHKRGSPLLALEPLSRNVAVRRANPANRWILSTNTDMVFVPRAPDRSLSDVVTDLAGGFAGGFYELPRFEVPQTLWESVNRADPAGVIAAFERWGRRLHLNEVVTAAPHIRFDAPGDFQLVLREQLVAIHGFNEEMVLGWHVDSNLAMRLYLLYGRTDSLLDHVFAYHCDHTRQATVMHRAFRAGNDQNRFIYEVTSPDVPAQAETWGLPGVAVEELRLADEQTGRFAGALEDVLPGMVEPLTTDVYSPQSYNHAVLYDTAHVLPYLADHLATLPPDADLGYVGGNVDLLRALAHFRDALGHGGRILVDRETLRCAKPGGWAPLPTTCHVVPRRDLVESAGAFVVDLAMMDFPSKPNADGILVPVETQAAVEYRQQLRVSFAVCLAAERARVWRRRAAARKLFVVGLHHTWFEPVVGDALGLIPAPYGTHVQHGFIRLPERDEEAPPAEHVAGEAALGDVPAVAAAAGGSADAPAWPAPEPPATELLPRDAAGAVEAPDSQHEGAATAVAASSAAHRGRRLLLVVPGLPGYDQESVARYTDALAQELRARGHAVSLLAGVYDNTQPDGLLTHALHEGLAFARINRRTLPAGDREFRDDRIAAVFERHLAGLDVELVHFHELGGVSAAALQACARLGVPVVVTLHDAWLLCEQRHLLQADGRFCEAGPATAERCARCLAARRPFSRFAQDLPALVRIFTQRQEYLRACLAGIDTLLAPSRFVERELARHGLHHPRVRVVPRGRPPAPRSAHRPSEGALRFVVLADVALPEDIRFLARALSLVARGRAQLDLYGSIADYEAFDRALAEVPPWVDFCYWGTYAPEDVPSILAQSDAALLLPHVWDHPTLGAQCFDAGLPVVGPRIGAVPEIIRDGETGLLFQPGDHADLAAKLRHLADDPRRVAALRRRIGVVRAVAEDAAELERVYEDVLARTCAAAHPGAPPVRSVAGDGGDATDAAAVAAFDDGRRHAEAGRWDEAARHLNRALDRSPLLAAAHYLLGCVEVQRGRVEAALGALRRAVELSPREVDFHNALGVALYQTGNLLGAEAALRQAAALEDQRADVWSNLGELCEALQRWPDARAAYERALALAPDDEELGARLARVRELEAPLGAFPGVEQARRPEGARTEVTP